MEELKICLSVEHSCGYLGFKLPIAVTPPLILSLTNTPLPVYSSSATEPAESPDLPGSQLTIDRHRRWQDIEAEWAQSEREEHDEQEAEQGEEEAVGVTRLDISGRPPEPPPPPPGPPPPALLRGQGDGSSGEAAEKAAAAGGDQSAALKVCGREQKGCGLFLSDTGCLGAISLRK